MSAKFALTTLFVLISISNLYTQVTQEWVALYNGNGNYFDIPNSITVDDSGYIYVTGESSIDSTINSDFVTIKYNPLGKIIWVATFNGIGDSADNAVSIVTDD